MNAKKTACLKRQVTINQSDLPLACPPLDTEVWNAHPRVYLPIEATGEILCPYCGTNYRLL